MNVLVVDDQLFVGILERRVELVAASPIRVSHTSSHPRALMRVGAVLSVCARIDGAGKGAIGRAIVSR